MNSEVFSSFVRHSFCGDQMPQDYLPTKVAALRMFPKLAMGLDSHQMLAASLYHNNGPNALARVATANPMHRGGLLGAVKNMAPAVGGIRTPGTNPLRAVASGVLHAKLASVLEHGAELAGLGVLGVPVAKTLRDPNATAQERNRAKWEAAGLGTLAVPSAYHLMTRR